MLPNHISDNLKLNKDYYSLYDMDNIERCKVDPDYLGDVMIVNDDLIWSSIHKYIGNPSTVAALNNITKEDIFQLGSIGFLRAIEAFDTTMGYKFSSLAVLYITGEIKDYLKSDTGIIRLSRKAFNMKKKISKVEEKLGFIPTPIELSVILNEKEERVLRVLELKNNITSLNCPMTTSIQDSNYLIDLVEDNTTSIEDNVEEKMFLEEVFYNIGDEATTLEKEILELYLKGIPQINIAKKFSITPMKVSRVLKKLYDIIEERMY